LNTVKDLYKEMSVMTILHSPNQPKLKLYMSISCPFSNPKTL